MSTDFYGSEFFGGSFFGVGVVVASPDFGRIVFSGKAPASVVTSFLIAEPPSGFILFTGQAPDVTGGTAIAEEEEEALRPTGGVRKRRWRILPDGRRVYATDFETALLLSQFRKQKRIEEKIPLHQVVRVAEQVHPNDTQRSEKDKRQEEELLVTLL